MTLRGRLLRLKKECANLRPAEQVGNEVLVQAATDEELVRIIELGELARQRYPDGKEPANWTDYLPRAERAEARRLLASIGMRARTHRGP